MLLKLQHFSSDICLLYLTCASYCKLITEFTYVVDTVIIIVS